MSKKTHISQLGKSFEYLQNPVLRSQEIGEQLLIIKDAFVADITFSKIKWENIQFVNCDFAGGYQIKLDELNNCRFIECNFEAIINWGTQTNVQFLRCKTYGGSNIIGDRGSKNVIHEECEFIGKTEDRNNYGFIASYGEVTFSQCHLTWFSLMGSTALTIIDCKLIGAKILTDNLPNSGPDFDRSSIYIKGSVLIGLTKMINANLTNLTILNTHYESIDLTNATFTGDFRMEQCQGGNTKILVKERAQNFTIKNCHMQSNSKEKFRFYIACSAQTAFIDGLKIQNSSEVAEIRFGAQGGIEIENGVEVIYPPEFARKITISNTSIPQFNFEYSAANYFLIKDCEFDRANFRKSRYNKLEIINTRISRQIDFTDTKVDEQNIEFIAGFKNRIELTDGSNVRIPR
ncbi:hypothetical protein [Sapientia aquatica]|uniref:Right-handed parallel beta-helix repeat-containing protein n=1 Tax=Sapientia aquatica TaxID=1549640 RepID=A0A4R5VRC9_9BURK|nr:hypothetical protein [Sapientia aquatica]TDK61289.1 hypothetical protein E2I14_17050 [Sapientia aquatica]